MWALLIVSMMIITRIYLPARDIAHLPRNERALAEKDQRLKVYHYPISAFLLVVNISVIIMNISDTFSGLFPVVAIGILSMYMVYLIYTVSRWLIAEYRTARQKKQLG